jgi:hypothetical protein
MFTSLYATGLSGHPKIVLRTSESLPPPVRRSPMFGKFSVFTWATLVCAALITVLLAQSPGEAYRLCTFKGTVVDHGWRSMTVKSGRQCAEVNVGWRTKYLPNRRPCLGERVAVDFILEDGYMKATKVVSLSPRPASVRCYPPPPPSTAVCRDVGGTERSSGVSSCPSPRSVCSSRPPSYVTDRSWSPRKKRTTTRKSRRITQRKEQPKKPETTPKPPKEPRKPPAASNTLTGEVVASSPQALMLRVMEDGASEQVNVKVGLRTKFIPFRRPTVGEKVEVDYRQENGDKVGYQVKVIQ